MSQISSPAPCYILADRQQYSTCHVRVPDLEHRLSAIVLGGKFYGFFQVAAEPRKAIAILIKLAYRGDAVALTKMPKGYGIWVAEPDAQPPATNQERIAPAPAPCFLLVSQYPHQPVRARVPDLAQPVDALVVNQQYYSIFKAELPADYALEILAKLLQRGDQSLLMSGKTGFVVGIYEPDASVIEDAPEGIVPQQFG